jgi:asparagine synthase (glutamine-hydrolysing)
MREDFAKAHASRDTARVFLDSLDVSGVLEGRDALNKSLFLWVHFAELYPHLDDRIEMAHSIEGRVPFLDHHVVEFIGKVPVHLKSAA